MLSARSAVLVLVSQALGELRLGAQSRCARDPSARKTAHGTAAISTRSVMPSTVVTPPSR